MPACGTITAGSGTYTFTPYHSAGRCIELVDWGITHKNGATFTPAQPSWATLVAQTGYISKVTPSGGTEEWRYVLPLLLTINIDLAFPDGERDNVYTFFYSIQRSDCVGGITTCTTTLALPNACNAAAQADVFRSLYFAYDSFPNDQLLSRVPVPDIGATLPVSVQTIADHKAADCGWTTFEYLFPNDFHTESGLIALSNNYGLWTINKLGAAYPGCPTELVADANTDWPNATAFDTKRDRLYYCGTGTPPDVRYVTRDGAGDTQLVDLASVSGVTNLTSSGGFAYAPDLDALLINVTVSGAFYLCKVDCATGDAELIGELPGFSGVVVGSGFIYSPSKQSIAYYDSTNQNFRVVKVSDLGDYYNVDTGAVTNPHWPVWDPRTERWYFVGSATIYRIADDDTGLEAIYTHGTNINGWLLMTTFEAPEPVVYEDLISAWDFNGNAEDNFGPDDLSEVGSPSYVAGKINDCISFDGTLGQRAEVASNANNQFGNRAWTIHGWVNIPTLPTAGNYDVICHKDGNFANREMIFYFNGDTGTLDLEIYDGTTTQRASVTVSSAGFAGVWKSFEIYMDPSVGANGEAGIRIDGGAATTGALSGAAGVNGAHFAFGDRSNGSVGSALKVDAAFRWNKLLSDAERTWFNAAAREWRDLRFYPDEPT